MTAFLAAIFVLSGAAGLIYESIWSRYLGLFVGHSAYAQVLVLVIFLGGMSAGAWMVARVGRRLTDPLMAYAAVEAVVGIVGFVFHDAYGAITGWAYATLFPVMPAGSVLLVAKWMIGALLILPQSILLGATFPLMSMGLLRLTSGDRAGRTLAVLYAANSLGAAGGVLLAGFYILPLFGLPGTVLVAAVANLACALSVYLVLRVRATRGLTETVHRPDPELGRADTTPTSSSRGALRGVLLATAFGTAVASFIYEVAWIRMLSLVLGSATHSFELMLSAFILGLAGGAWWIRARIDRWPDRMAVLFRIQVIMGTLAAGTVLAYGFTFEWMEAILSAVARTEAGYQAYGLLRYAVCLLIMLPATVCAGMTLPLITRLLADSGEGESAVGQVYAINTVGSIVGAALASLVLMPVLGLRLLLLLGAALDLGCALLLMRGRSLEGRAPDRGRSWFGERAALAASGLLIALLAGLTRFDPALLSSGVFRSGRIDRSAARTLLEYVDGRTASVSVYEGGPARMRQRTIATNGKPDASLLLEWLDTIPRNPGQAFLVKDEATQALLPLVTVSHRPRARRAAVIGQGSGMSSHFLLGSPELESLVTIEIEPAMIAASRAFYPGNRRVFDDPRSRFVIDDARSVFAGASQGFDLIMSEPSNPWVSGVSGLFTEEFYARVRGALAPGGVFGQWMHLYEMSDPLMITVLRALYAQFPVFRIYLTNTSDVLIVATAADGLPAPDWGVFTWPAIARDFARFRPISADQLNRSLVATSEELAPLLAMPTGRNSDFFPLLDLGAEHARFLGSAVESLRRDDPVTERFDLFAALGARRRDQAPPVFGALGVPAVLQAAIGAHLRAGVLPATADTTTTARAVRTAAERLRAFDRQLAGDVAPLDWGLWLEGFSEVEALWHGGVQGGIDSAFHARAEGFAVRHEAPVAVLHGVRLARAIRSWDWSGIVREGTPLAEARVRTGERWVRDDLLRDALVVALLKSRRPNEAAQALQRLAPFSTRPPEDLRNQLLEAYCQPPQGG